MERPGKILVVDDEKGIREGCRRVLLSEGHQVETAEDGELGLATARSGAFDLLLVDVKMPVIGGIEMVKQMREIDPDAVCVMITGYATLETAVEATRNGAYDFLPKPFTPDELLAKVGKGLERRRLVLEARRLRDERERIKSQFVGMVAHELRAPLAAIQGYLEVILSGAAGEDPEQFRCMLERARERAAALINLIDDLLDVSSIEAGRIARRIELVRLPNLLLDLLEMMQPRAETRNISLAEALPGDLPPVRADREDMARLFTNLLGNAIKYNREGGSVRLTGRVEGHYLRVDVADTGIGIPKESVPRLFDEFYRVKTPETRHIAGTGLGLSIVKRIVEAHHGFVEVESEPGVGSTFSVFLPAAPEPS